MARYEHLSIFAEAYRLAVHVEQQVQGFSSRHRLALGADLRREAQILPRLIIRANRTPERVANRK
ncbi:MAG: hypothetical protein AB7Q01_08245 [Gammaproteobacteria bacterium]